MEIIKASIDGLVVIQPKVYEDERGYFMESFKESFIEEHFPNIHFLQENESKSSFGVLRGLHFQKPPFEQTKLVRVIRGEVLDVAVDIRKDSPSFGKWESIILSEKNKRQFYIPRGFAHGFVVLSEEAIFSYKVDNIYSPRDEGCIRYDDSDLNIDWKINTTLIKVSEKDNPMLNDKIKSIKELRDQQRV